MLIKISGKIFPVHISPKTGARNSQGESKVYKVEIKKIEKIVLSKA